MKSLKRNKSDGIDGFPPGMLKNCHKEISQPLLHIINVSLNSGIVPSSWKIAKVVPIHKKGTTTDLVIIAHYPFSKFCRRCSKKQYTVNQWITLKVRTCWRIDNLATVEKDRPLYYCTTNKKLTTLTVILISAIGSKTL